MLANSRRLVGEVSVYCSQNCAIIMREDPGTFACISNNALKISWNGGYLISSIVQTCPVGSIKLKAMKTHGFKSCFVKSVYSLDKPSIKKATKYHNN